MSMKKIINSKREAEKFARYLQAQGMKAKAVRGRYGWTTVSEGTV